MEVRTVLAPNPGLFTGPGTNTYLVVSGGNALVIDPGPVDDSHLEAIHAAMAGLSPVGALGFPGLPFGYVSGGYTFNKKTEKVPGKTPLPPGHRIGIAGGLNFAHGVGKDIFQNDDENWAIIHSIQNCTKCPSNLV